MRQDALTGWPSAGQVETAAKSVLAVGALLAAVWAFATRWSRRRRAARAKRELEAKAIRYLLDAQHHVLRLLNNGLLPADEIRRQKILIQELRRELAAVDGHDELLAATDATDAHEELIRVMTRTQAIHARKQVIRAGLEAKRERDGNPFKDGWTPEEPDR